MSDVKRIVIVGGVAGGASAAARSRRLSEDAEIVVFERGEYISFANCGLPYHIGGAIKDRDRLLVQTPESMKRRFEIDVRIDTEVVKIDRDAKEVVVRNVVSGQESVEAYDKLVLSPGAEPVRPPMEGIDNEKIFTLRSMKDMDAIKRVVDEDKPGKALVIGGGYIGLEMAEAFSERGLEVTLVEAQDQVFMPLDGEMVTPIHQHLAMNGVELKLGAMVEGFADADVVVQAKLSTGDSIEADIVVLAIGVRPEVTLAKDAGLDVGSRGGIVVDEHMRTSDADIYAVGDAVEVKDFVCGADAVVPLAGPANRQGRIAADNIFGRDSVYKRTQGTAICKIFDLAAGVTGMNERGLKHAGMKYEKVYVHQSDHAGYYPGATPISMKLLFDPEDGRVLGAQAVGAKGIDKRIDVIAVAMRGSMTVYDLCDLELSYAPPFGSAKDVVNYAGFVASNVLKGDMAVCHYDDVTNLSDDQVLVDVRTESENQGGTIPGAINIQVDELRSRLGELDKSKEVLVFCRVGLRGYIASRILKNNGFACKNLSGGMLTYSANAFDWKTLKVNRPAKQETKEQCKMQDNNTSAAEVKVEIDACGLQCPGPVMKLKEGLDSVAEGEAIAITSTDPGFAADMPAWCGSTGNSLVSIDPVSGGYRAVIAKGQASGACELSAPKGNGQTIVVFNNDFDKAMAAFIIANGAASMGGEVTMFFTFWGLNLLRRSDSVPVKKTLVEKMFGFMMPKGPNKSPLSKMNMGGMGLAMIKGIMRKKNVTPLEELIESAKNSGVNLVACAMSMDLMGIKEEELIDGVDTGGVAMYLSKAQMGNVNLFI